MALSKYTFGDLIEQSVKKNSDGKYSEDDTIGVNIDKEIRIMRGETKDKDLTKFYLVKPGVFVYNPRGSRKLGLGYNDSNKTYITTFNNIIFIIKECAKDIIHPIYLFMYLSRKEWDRKAEYLAWGSSTEVFSWETFCDTELDLPPLAVQQKYVNIYKSMLENQRCYETALEDLKLVCDAYIEDLQRKYPLQRIGDYLNESNQRNEGGLTLESVRGLATSKEMIPTKADMDGVSLSNYKTVSPHQIAYVSDTSRRGDKMSLGYNDSDETYLVSSISTVFETKEESLLSDYLMLFLTRSEFDRYARFNSWGSSRETFNYSDMCDVQIPIPEIKIQRSIADIYKVYVERKRINEASPVSVGRKIAEYSVYAAKAS